MKRKPVREKHGHSYRPEYALWEAIVQRCTNRRCRNYKNYGARGITMHSAWRQSFAAFFAHVGPRPGPGFTLERKDNTKGYVPGNVRWATYGEQNRNRRGNWKITWKGRTMVIADWAKESAVSVSTLRRRLLEGWPMRKAMTVPPARRGRLVWREKQRA